MKSHVPSWIRLERLQAYYAEKVKEKYYSRSPSFACEMCDAEFPELRMMCTKCRRGVVKPKQEIEIKLKARIREYERKK